jgi:hypothetical protein
MKISYESPSFVDLNPPNKAGYETVDGMCQVGATPEQQNCSMGSTHVGILCCNQGARASQACLSGSTQQW